MTPAAYTQPALIDEPLPQTPQGAGAPRKSAPPSRVESSPGPRPAVIRLGRDPRGRFTSAPEVAAAVAERATAIHADPLPNRVASREAIRRAVHRAAAEHGGLVHIADVRPHVPEWARGPQLGAALRTWTQRGYLAPTGDWAPNGDPNPKAGNASKPAPVRVLVRPIPAEEC